MTDKLTFDIESLIDTKLHPFQKDLLQGYNKGELTIFASGRQSGKSSLNSYLNEYMAVFNQPAYKKTSFSKVDNDEWVTVQCNREIAAWVREQKQKYWYEHNGMKFGSSFDLHSKLYTMLKLKFTP